ncbi:MAG: hypothetical protein CMC48_06200 [Flavobacteriaceae bacterium]|nr:hypothetical protein [Flavobacteriaceae bacterium]
MRLLFRIILIIFISYNNLFSQERFSPVEIPILLSGTFGEFRKTHFHTGIDIKTQGKEGFRVRAIDDGDLIRVKVSTSGYGKAVYIRHYDGTTSVYAHLKKFSPKIQQIIKKLQYDKKRFEIEKFFKQGEIKLKKTEIIGFSGNTGGSSGPHLHFELRDTEKEKPLNPLKYGYFVIDTIPPNIQNIFIYKFLTKHISKKIKIELRKNKNFYSTNDTLIINGMIGVGYKGYDKQNSSYNRNGIYKRELFINGKSVFSYKFDDLIFPDGKKIDLLIDYEAYNIDKVRIKKLYQTINSKFSFLEKSDNYGLFKVMKDSLYNIKIVYEDINKNKSILRMVIKGGENENELNFSENNIEDKLYHPDTEYNKNFKKLNLNIPKNAFYESTNLNFEYKLDTLIIEKFTKAPKKGLNLEFLLPKNLDSLNLRQTCIGRLNTNQRGVKNKVKYVFGIKKDSLIYAKSISGGKYFLTKDSISPSIKPINFRNQKWVSNLSTLKIRIDDDFSGIKKYSGSINGKWILMEHEPKRKLLFFEFDDVKFSKTELKLNLHVEDMVGNVTEFEATIYRKKIK